MLKCPETLAIIALLCINLSSCDLVNFSDLHPVVQSSIKSEEGDFRGTSFGSNIDQIKQVEVEGFVEGDNEFLFYSLEHPDSDQTTDVFYFFDQHGQLNKINIDIWLENSDDLNIVFEDLRRYYKSKYSGVKQLEFAENQKVVFEASGLGDEPSTIEIQIWNESNGSDKFVTSMSLINFPNFSD